MTPLEELDDTTKGLERWHGGRFVLIDCRSFFTMAGGVYLYPGRNTNPKRLRLHGNIWKDMHLILNEIASDFSCCHVSPLPNRLRLPYNRPHVFLPNGISSCDSRPHFFCRIGFPPVIADRTPSCRMVFGDSYPPCWLSNDPLHTGSTCYSQC